MKLLNENTFNLISEFVKKNNGNHLAFFKNKKQEICFVFTKNTSSTLLSQTKNVSIYKLNKTLQTFDKIGELNFSHFKKVFKIKKAFLINLIVPDLTERSLGNASYALKYLDILLQEYSINEIHSNFVPFEFNSNKSLKKFYLDNGYRFEALSGLKLRKKNSHLYISKLTEHVDFYRDYFFINNVDKKELEKTRLLEAELKFMTKL